MTKKMVGVSILSLGIAPQLLLLCLAVQSRGQDKAPSVLLPGAATLTPAAPGPVKLSAKQLYVARSKFDCILVASPEGIVKISQPTGGAKPFSKPPTYVDGDGSYQIRADISVKIVTPLELKAVFSDGDGTTQSKIFLEKNVWCIEAVASGTVELLFIVDGGKEIVRQLIECNVGPRPPTPDPTPPTSLLKHLTFVGAELKPASLAVNNDAGLRAWLKDSGVSVHVLLAGDPSVASKGLAAAVAKAGGAPAVVLQDDLGHVIGWGSVESVDGIRALASKHLRR